MLKFVYKICPVFVKYVDKDDASLHGFAGFSYGISIRISKDYKDDLGLLEHELTHSRQFYKSVGLWGLLYKRPNLRYEYELEAYRVQLSYAEEAEKERLAELFAGFIANDYGLAIDRDKTKALLLK